MKRDLTGRLIFLAYSWNGKDKLVPSGVEHE